MKSVMWMNSFRVGKSRKGSIKELNVVSIITNIVSFTNVIR
jgi:hypothetical protein